MRITDQVLTDAVQGLTEAAGAAYELQWSSGFVRVRRRVNGRPRDVTPLLMKRELYAWLCGALWALGEPGAEPRFDRRLPPVDLLDLAHEAVRTAVDAGGRPEGYYRELRAALVALAAARDYRAPLENPDD